MSRARGRETADVPYDDEPTVDEFQLTTDRLVLALIDQTDVAEAYALLTDPRLTFLDPAYVPASEAALGEHVRRIRAREHNDEAYRLYQWAVRLNDTGDLAALVTAELKREAVLHPGGPATETLVVETTTYVHPDHQGSGHRHGREAGRRVQRFVADRFGVTVRQALIRWDNEKSQALATGDGMAKQGTGMTPTRLRNLARGDPAVRRCATGVSEAPLSPCAIRSPRAGSRPWRPRTPA